MIQITQLTKSFGRNKVLENIDLEMRQGQVYCLLGKNGAGKSTLINIILDLVKLDHGSVHFYAKSHNLLSSEDKCRIGAVTENLALVKEFNAYEFLNFTGRLYGMKSDLIKQRSNDLLQYFFEDADTLKKNIGSYSTGMQKKIAFCAAVLHTPELLILDEPFSSLDPLVADQMVMFVKKYQREDRLIFISSHDLSYVEKVATHIGVLDDTHLVFNAGLKDFTDNGVKEIDAALLKIIRPSESKLEKIDWL